MLGGLGRALMVPIACEGSNLGLALQPTKAQKIYNSPEFRSFNKEKNVALATEMV